MANEEACEEGAEAQGTVNVQGIHEAINSTADCGEDGIRDLRIIERFLSDDVGDEARAKIEAVLDEALAEE